MCKTIKQKVKFKAPPESIYQLLADLKKHGSFSGSKAHISNKIGGKFSTYDGLISGINIDLLSGKRIVQAWRDTDFPEGIFSMASFHLTRTKDGGTELVLTHRGVPKDLIPRIEQRWKDFYWDKIKRYLDLK